MEIHVVLRLEFRSEGSLLMMGLKLRNEQKMIMFVYISLLKFDHKPQQGRSFEAH